MRFGVFLLAAGFPGLSHGEVLAATVEAALAAERAGFDDVWFAEHHFMSYGVCPSAVTMASYALGRTRRIEVGTAVSVLSTAHPVALAEQAAMLAHLSGGRLRLGVGRGGPWVDLEVFGTGLDRYEKGFAESLDLLLAALTQETVAARGQVFDFRSVRMVPGGASPPVVVAATSAASVALAAERNLPMLLGMHIGDDGKREMIEQYGGHGAGGVGHVAAVVAYAGDTTVAARRLLMDRLPRWLEPGLAGYVPVDGRSRPRRDPYEYADLLCRIHPIGSVAYCVETMATTIERTGLRHLILMVEGAGDPALTNENIARLGAEVLPELRRRFSSRRAPDAGSGSASEA